MKQIILLLLLPAFCWSQSANGCYQLYYSKGVDFMGNHEYGEAISQFVAALVTCKDIPAENDLSQRIEESKRRWAGDLQNSVKEAEKAWKEAVKARDSLANAKKAEVQARQQAEENAEKAYRRGIRAESFRLALQADMARRQGKKTDALLLSWMGWQLSDSVQAFVVRAFGEAVRDSFTRTVFHADAPIREVQLFADGAEVLVQTADRRYFIINLSGDASVVQLPERYLHIQSSPKSPNLLAWGAGKELLLLNAAGKEEAELSGHQDGIRMALFAPDGQKILSCSRDNSARLWDLRGQIIAVLSGHQGNVQQAEFSADGSRILTRSTDGDVRLWDAEGNALGIVGDGSVFAVQCTFTAANHIFIQFADQSAGLWKSSDLKAPLRRFTTLKDFQVSRGGQYLALLTQAGGLSLLNADGRQIKDLEGNGQWKGFRFSSDGECLIGWGKDHLVYLWRLDGKLLGSFTGHRSQLLFADYRRDKQLLLSTSDDGNTILWDQQGSVLSEWSQGAQRNSMAFFAPAGDALLTLDDKGRSLVRSPLPLDVYRQTERSAVLHSNAFQKVRETYQVQFLETLSEGR